MEHTIVSVQWLSQHSQDEDLIILDASPKATVSGSKSEYENLAIPNSRVFDIKGQFSDPDSRFPNTVPSEAQFETACRMLGINKDSKIVVYDNMGIYTSPRAWWLFKVMGHEAVMVLDGGLPEWVRHAYPTIAKSASNVPTQAGDFEARFKPEYVKSFSDVVRNVSEDTFQIADARSAGRFNGTDPEPRKHLQSGHIPNSVNIPFKSVLEDGKFKSPEALQAIFEQNIDPTKQLAFSCGSGITACIIMLASEIASRESRYLYDGSWTEWAELNNLTS